MPRGRTICIASSNPAALPVQSTTTASDADRELATKLGEELKASTSLDALRAMNQRQEVIDALTRWQKDRPELFSELRAIGTARLKELQAAG